jgi:hypothetical protein
LALVNATYTAADIDAKLAPPKALFFVTCAIKASKAGAAAGAAMAARPRLNLSFHPPR